MLQVNVEVDLNLNKSCVDTVMDEKVEKLQSLLNVIERKVCFKNFKRRFIWLFFYACNIPFNIVESDPFHNLICLLGRSYKLPSLKELPGRILDSVHGQMEDLVHERERRNTCHWQVE